MLVQTLQVAVRHIWLLDYSRAQHAARAGEQPAPAEIRGGIAFEGVSFAYPGTETEVLSDVNLWLPPGAVVAGGGGKGGRQSPPLNTPLPVTSVAALFFKKKKNRTSRYDPSVDVLMPA